MWEFTNDRPIYLQLIEQMTLKIANGTYQPGDKCPSVRDIATEANVNPNTVQRAFAELERNGVVCAQRTTGRYITEDAEMIGKLKEKLAFEEIKEFLSRMQKLGLSENDIVKMISDYKKEEN